MLGNSCADFRLRGHRTCLVCFGNRRWRHPLILRIGNSWIADLVIRSERTRCFVRGALLTGVNVFLPLWARVGAVDVEAPGRVGAASNMPQNSLHTFFSSANSAIMGRTELRLG